MPADDHDRPFLWTEQQLTSAMASAMRDVLTDPAVIEKQAEVLLTVIQRQAVVRTGSFLLGTVGKFLARWLVIGFILLMVARFAGVQSAVHVWDAATGKQP